MNKSQSVARVRANPDTYPGIKEWWISTQRDQMMPTRTEGWWVSPAGVATQIFEHLFEVMTDPYSFGFSPEEWRLWETYGVRRNRERVLGNVMRKGWMRVRGNGWGKPIEFNVSELTPNKIEKIKSFLQGIGAWKKVQVEVYEVIPNKVTSFLAEDFYDHDAEYLAHKWKHENGNMSTYNPTMPFG